MFQSTKTYGQEQGLSCAFRQWRADLSHCHLVHGYALGFRFVFECQKRDYRGWVMDFGGLKDLKQALKEQFDHRLAVAQDDPKFGFFAELEENGLAHIAVFPEGVGCENFAKRAYELAHEILVKVYLEEMVERGLRVVSCECSEHAGNSAIYIAE